MNRSPASDVPPGRPNGTFNVPPESPSLEGILE
jgi:hypothetical protein